MSNNDTIEYRINHDIKNIKNYIINMMYNVFIFFINLIEFINNGFRSLKNCIVGDSLDNKVYEITYLDQINNLSYNIYYLSLLQKIYLILTNYNSIPYSLDISTKNYIKKLLSLNTNGFLKIKFYAENDRNEVLINLKMFKLTNFLFKHTDLLIDNVIQNFIKNEVIYSDIKLLCVEIKCNEDAIDITSIFKKFKNSFKLDNIKLSDLILLLNENLLCNWSKINYINDLNNLNYLNLTITDDNFDENCYKLDDYINLKTLYEDLADKEIK